MMSKLSKETIDTINSILPDALKIKIKEQIKLSNEVKLAEAVTVDGKTLSYEGDALAVDTKVSVKDGDVLTPAEGEFSLVDPSGKAITITCVAGVVTEVADTKTESEEEMQPAQPAVDPMANITAQMSAQKESFETKLKEIESKFSAQSKLIESLQADNKVLLEMAGALVNTPVKEKDPAPTKAYNEMSNHERALYNRGKL